MVADVLIVKQMRLENGNVKMENGRKTVPPTRVFSAKSPETLETKDIALRWDVKKCGRI